MTEKILSEKELSEKHCAKIFLYFYNIKNLDNFFIVEKNYIQKSDHKFDYTSEIDVDIFAINTKNDLLKLQITKANYRENRVFNKNKNDRIKGKTKEIKCILIDLNDIRPHLSAIKTKLKKYEGKRINDIILLLDDLHFIPQKIFEKGLLSENNLDVKFKEVWYVGTSKKEEAYRIK